MVSSRVAPSNPTIHTYGATGNGRDYVEGQLGTWETDTQLDLVTAAAGRILECYTDQASFSDSVVIAGATTNTTYFRLIRPASGHRHNGTPNSGVKFTSTVAHMFDLQETAAALHDLVATMTRNSTTQDFHFRINSTGGAGKRIVGCIAANGVNSSSGWAAGFQCLENSDGFINCMSIDCPTVGFDATSGADPFAYNCTAIGSVDGWLIRAGSNWELKNCRSTGASNLDFDNTGGTTTGSNNNLSSDATAPGTSSITTATPAYANAAGDDYHLTSSDPGYETGANLSATFDDDIDGDTITTWSIGADGQVAAVSSTSIAASYYYRRSR